MTELTISNLQEQIKSWDEYSKGKSILFVTDKTFSKPIDEDDVAILSECIELIVSEGCTVLNFLLYTHGGDLYMSHAIAKLLIKSFNHINVYVPGKALSSGTLIALSGNMIHLGKKAMFSPLDPQITGANPTSRDNAQSISFSDIRSFLAMGQKYFGYQEFEKKELLKILSQSIFPVSMARMYRTEEDVKAFGNNLLKRHNPHLEDSFKSDLIEYLVNGFSSHNQYINRDEIKALGLNVECVDVKTEIIMDGLIDICHELLKSINGNVKIVSSIIASSSFFKTTDVVLLSKEVAPYET